jgi:hypothetical protein
MIRAYAYRNQASRLALILAYMSLNQIDPAYGDSFSAAGRRFSRAGTSSRLIGLDDADHAIEG